MPDQRTGRNTHFAMEDVVLAAFAVFWTQSPSFLAQQTRMRQVHGHSNAETLFGMARIPSDNHIRDLLDPVPPATLFPWFGQIVARLQARDRLAPYRVLDGQLLIALDGTQYHHFETIHCAQCTRKAHADGKLSYAHTTVTPVLVAPGCPRVLPLPPEFVTPQDGHAKQDCEHAAAKRWMARCGPAWQATPVTLLGDDLYSRQPLCEAARAAGFHFLFVCKPSSHPTLYEWLAGLRKAGQVDTVQRTCHHRGTCHHSKPFSRWLGTILRHWMDSVPVKRLNFIAWLRISQPFIRTPTNIGGAANGSPVNLHFPATLLFADLPRSD